MDKVKIQNSNKTFWIFIFAFSILIFTLTFAQESPKEEESLFVAKKAFADGFYEVSLGLLERFLKNYPNSAKAAQVNLLIGQCYFQQNRFLDALTKFEELLNQAAAKDIKDAVIYWIAEVHFRGNNYSKAASFYKMITGDFPGSSYIMQAYYSLGWCLFQERKFQDALEYFRITEERYPQEPQAQDSSFKIVECLYSLKDYKTLKERLKIYLKQNLKDAVRLSYLYFYLAESEYYLNNFQDAIEDYSKVIANTKDEQIIALSKLGMGWSYLKLKQYQDTQAAFLAINVDSLEKKSTDILLLGKATLFFQTNKFEEAKNIYAELLSKSTDTPVVVQAYLGKADSLYNLNKYKEAISIYKEALERPYPELNLPALVDKLHYGLAWSYLKEGEFKEAIDEFKKIAKQTEDKTVKIAALCQIGDAYQDSGDFPKALSVYDNILKEYPDSFYNDYIQYQSGIAMLKLSNYDGAILVFQNFKKNFPDSKLSDDATYALGLAYFQKEDYNSSREIFEKFLREFKESNLMPESIYLLGTSLYNLGKFSEAIDIFKNIAKLYNQDAELLQKAEYEIADCYYRMGNESEAMQRFKMLRSKYPDSSLTAEIMWWLGEYYYRHGDLDISRRYFSSLIQDFPKSNLIADAYYILGSTYEEEARYEEALNNFKRVIELGRQDLSATAAVAIADIYVKQDKFDLAIKNYKDVTGKHPNLANLVYPKMAELYNSIGQRQEALDFYRKSLDIVPVRQAAEIQFKIAEILQSEGKVNDAIEEYLKVTYLYSEGNSLAVKSLLRVGLAYEDQENFKEALNIYNRVRSMNTEEAKYAQERIDWIKTHVK